MGITRAGNNYRPAIEWPTLGLVMATYAGWCAAGWLRWPVLPAPALLLMTLLTVLHSSLVHETVHDHPTRHPVANELLVFCSLGLVWPYRRFRALHLRHHVNTRLTDPVDDPESGYWPAWRPRAFSPWRRALLRANNTLMGRVVLGPLLAVVTLVTEDLKHARRQPRVILQAWALHGVGLVPVLMLVQWGFGIGIDLYVFTAVWGAHALLALRTYAEHRWHESATGRCIIVERSWLSLLFLNNNLHLVHHCHPSLPWYKLPAVYHARRAHWRMLGGGYVVRDYWTLVRAFAFRCKEPLAHPTLHCLESHQALPASVPVDS